MPQVTEPDGTENFPHRTVPTATRQKDTDNFNESQKAYSQNQSERADSSASQIHTHGTMNKTGAMHNNTAKKNRKMRN